MTTQRNEIAITVVTTLMTIVAWAYLIGVLSSKLAYPTII